MKNLIVKRSFKVEGLRYPKGTKCEAQHVIGEPRLKLFKIHNENGHSFITNEAHVNKLFTEA